jgi:hypothetical protein
MLTWINKPLYSSHLFPLCCVWDRVSSRMGRVYAQLESSGVLKAQAFICPNLGICGWRDMGSLRLHFLSAG